jgi:hypothetical protein
LGLAALNAFLSFLVLGAGTVAALLLIVGLECHACTCVLISDIDRMLSEPRCVRKMNPTFGGKKRNLKARTARAPVT